MTRSRIALVGAELEENLSLRYLAAAVEQDGFDAVRVQLNHASEGSTAVKAVLASGAKVVGLSVSFQLRAPETLAVADELRAGGYRGHVCVGGHFATFEYENILRHYPGVDSVARHEGEDTFRALCALVRDGKPVPALPGLVVREGSGMKVGEKRPLPALDSLPFPDRRGEPLDILGVRCAPLVGSRGCYADCSFCCIHAYSENAEGPRYRARSVESVVAEMAEERRTRGVRLFIFHDDNFFVPSLQKNLGRYRRMGVLMREEGLDDVALVIKCRPNDVHPELFSLLRSLGVIRAYVGIESSSDEGIVSLNRRVSAQDNQRALRVLRELGVYASFNVLLFDPEATLRGIEQNLDFLDEFTDIPFNFCRAEVYAGTPLEAMLRAQGRLSGDWLAWTYAMREPRVEVLFRIVSTAFGPRNFRVDGAANLNMGIRFDVTALRHFHPSLWDPDLEARGVALSRAVGQDSVRRLRAALGFVRDVGLADHSAVKAFTVSLARDIARADLGFVGEIKALRREVEHRLSEPGARGSGTQLGHEGRPEPGGSP